LTQAYLSHLLLFSCLLVPTPTEDGDERFGGRLFKLLNLTGPDTTCPSLPVTVQPASIVVAVSDSESVPGPVGIDVASRTGICAASDVLVPIPLPVDPSPGPKPGTQPSRGFSIDPSTSFMLFPWTVAWLSVSILPFSLVAWSISN
jgi:hypothetical protein